MSALCISIAAVGLTSSKSPAVIGCNCKSAASTPPPPISANSWAPAWACLPWSVKVSNSLLTLTGTLLKSSCIVLKPFVNLSVTPLAPLLKLEKASLISWVLNDGNLSPIASDTLPSPLEAASPKSLKALSPQTYFTPLKPKPYKPFAPKSIPISSMNLLPISCNLDCADSTGKFNNALSLP